MASIGIPIGNRMKISLILVTLLRVVLGAILLFAGITKLMGFSTFATNVGSYQMLPIALVKPINYSFENSP